MCFFLVFRGVFDFFLRFFLEVFAGFLERCLMIFLVFLYFLSGSLVRFIR